jgi:hypothetical protein
MLYPQRVAHPLATLDIAAGLPDAEENRGDGSRGSEPSQEREHIAKQPALEEQPQRGGEESSLGRIEVRLIAGVRPLPAPHDGERRSTDEVRPRKVEDAAVAPVPNTTVA